MKRLISSPRVASFWSFVVLLIALCVPGASLVSGSAAARATSTASRASVAKIDASTRKTTTKAVKKTLKKVSPPCRFGGAAKTQRCIAAGPSCRGLPKIKNAALRKRLTTLCKGPRGSIPRNVTISGTPVISGVQAGGSSPGSPAVGGTDPGTGAPSTKVHPAGRRNYWGSAIDRGVYGLEEPSLDPADLRGFETFETHAGKGMSIAHWYEGWYRDGVPVAFPLARMEAVRRHGSIPMISWYPKEHSAPEVNQPAFALSAITAGRYDDMIRAYAIDAKAWGKPLFLRFAPEMNGYWNSWSEKVNGNTVGSFVPMWRHVHDIFIRAGAMNVTWVWSPNIEYSVDQTPMAALYPGDRYVDWTALDGYNWGRHPGQRDFGFNAFDVLFEPSYQLVTAISPSKPLMIAETGSSEFGGSKAAWISDAISHQIPTYYPAIRAFVWLNLRRELEDWAIETSPSAQSAFARAIASPLYAPNEFDDIEGGPIKPLG